MRHPGIKRVVAFVVLVALVAVLAIGYVSFGIVNDTDKANRTTAMKLEGIKLTVTNVLAAGVQAAWDFATQMSANLELLAFPLRGAAVNEGDEVLRSYENGCVVKKDGDDFVLPEGAVTPLLEPMDNPESVLAVQSVEPFTGASGMFWSRMADDPEGEFLLCAYRRISGPYYYLYYVTQSEIDAFFEANVDSDGMIRSAEEVYGGLVVCFSKAEDALPLLYASGPFEDYDDAGALGLSAESTGEEPVQLTVDGVDYLCAVSDGMDIEGFGEVYVAYIVPYLNYYLSSLDSALLLPGVSLLILLVLLVWVMAVIGLMRRPVVTRSQRRRYAPGRVRLVAASLGVIGMAVILVTSVFTDALSSLYSATRNCQEALQTLDDMMTENATHAQTLTSQREGLYLGYANRIASLLADYPDLRTREQLAELSWTIDADYLMLYDEKGRETLSDSRYLGLAYGETPESSTYDFRRLITGVPSIVHPVCVDEVTGLERQLIGVSMGDGAAGGYESLIVAVRPDDDGGTLSVGDMLKSLTARDSLSLAVDKETGAVLVASDPELVGENMVDLGLSESGLRDGFMDFFTLNGQRWYGCSEEAEGTLYYYAASTDDMFTGLLANGLTRGLLFLAAYAVLALVLLSGYTEKKVEALGGTVVEDHELPRGDAARGRGFFGRVAGWWRGKSPERRAWFVLQVLLGLGLLALARMVLGGRGDGAASMFGYVLQGRWQRGVNLFAFTRIALLALGLLLTLLALEMVVSLVCGMLETRGETICRLVGNLAKYALVIVALFSSFDTLGFDTRALLASVGVFSLAFSLGAKDLVADLLAGVGLVFAGEYQIGDIVEIGGFRGRVWEIGVRTTTLINTDGAIKNISNRDISNVLNLSRMNSWATLQITVDGATPLAEVEAVIARELPAVGRSVEVIISGPEYRGVAAITAGNPTLAFAAECAEDDLPAVRSQLVVALHRMLAENGIGVK